MFFNNFIHARDQNVNNTKGKSMCLNNSVRDAEHNSDNTKKRNVFEGRRACLGGQHRPQSELRNTDYGIEGIITKADEKKHQEASKQGQT